MRFVPTRLGGVYLVELERREDERGFFARSYCEQEFGALGLATRYPQCNVSFNASRGTVRGLHYQRAPHEEAKVVRCTRGAIYDVVVDLRPGSPTYGQWCAAELDADNRAAMYVPEGCAHGFQTLEDATEVHYMMSASYHPASAAGVRWNDPALGIRWPLSAAVVSDRDAAFPGLAQKG